MGTGYAHVAVSKNVCQLIILESRLLLYVAVFFLYSICFFKKRSKSKSEVRGFV